MTNIFNGTHLTFSTTTTSQGWGTITGAIVDGEYINLRKQQFSSKCKLEMVDGKLTKIPCDGGL